MGGGSVLPPLVPPHHQRPLPFPDVCMGSDFANSYLHCTTYNLEAVVTAPFLCMLYVVGTQALALFCAGRCGPPPCVAKKWSSAISQHLKGEEVLTVHSRGAPIPRPLAPMGEPVVGNIGWVWGWAGDVYFVLIRARL